MYRWFNDDGQTETEIAVRLNEKGVRTDLDRNWTRSTVREVLTNEKYAYFSPSWTAFQADRGRHFKLNVDAVSARTWTIF